MIRERMKCLVPGCSELDRTRGLCPTHYLCALRVIQAGKATWAELESAGKAKPLKWHRKTSPDWFVTRPGKTEAPKA